MELRVASALKQPGETFSAALTQEIPPQKFSGREIVFAQPVQMEFTYSYDGKAFTISGRLQATLSSRCARCDEAFIETLTIPFSERFVKGALGNDEEDSYTFDGETLDLTPMVMDNLFLHIPIISVCSEDCRGLCPVCGCNLNTAQCACERVETDKETPPLASLGQLLNDGKEV